MKNIYIIIIAYLLISNYAIAQSVGITNGASFTPDASSALEVKSTNKGVLIPRVVLNDKTSSSSPISSPVEGLLIYNDGGTESEGFWYWDGTKWKRISSNNGTVDNTRFPMGEFYMEGNSASTTVAVQNTFYKVAGTTTFSGGGYQMTDGGASNRLKYTGPTMRMFHVACTFSIMSAQANKEAKLKIYHWDDSASSLIPLSNSVVHIKINSSSDVISTAIHVMATLDTNDYLELQVTNMTSADNFIITDMNMFAMGVNMGND